MRIELLRSTTALKVSPIDEFKMHSDEKGLKFDLILTFYQALLFWE
jgi:hypothetical protein